jgi:branched-chain amino acid transport system permease protein
MKRGFIIPCLAGLALLAAVIAPFFISTFTLTIATNAIVFAIFAVSLNLILGYAGLPSLGHAAFFGCGAYAIGLLAQSGIHNFVIELVAAILGSALLGFVLGPILLRTRAIYFLMATLAVGEVMRNLATSWRTVTNGDDGLYGIKLPGYLADGRHFYFFLLAALVVVVTVIAMLMCAPFGHTLRAVRDNRSRASILGIRPLTLEMSAFVISAAVAGFAGAMFAYAKGFVSPGVLSVETSADVLLMVVLGGPATLLGPVAGAVVIEAIRGIGSTYTNRWLTILGLLAVVVALEPQRYFGRRSRKTPAVSASAEAGSESKAAELPAMSLERRHPPALRRGSSARIAIRAAGVAKHFGGFSVLNGISLNVVEGERRGLIGPNGAGKTTFLNILSGITQPNDGRVHFGDRDITSLPPFERAKLGIGRTFQIGNLFEDCTVRENIVLGLLARDGHSLHFARALSRYNELQNEASQLLDEWGLRDLERVPVKVLAYGQRRLIEIVLAVSQRPKVLLLDEPAAGLSGNETKVIIQTISALDPQLSLIIVEHDMDLVFSVCDSVTVIANGRVLAEGTGDQVRRDKSVIEAYLGMPL